MLKNLMMFVGLMLFIVALFVAFATATVVRKWALAIVIVFGTDIGLIIEGLLRFNWISIVLIAVLGIGTLVLVVLRFVSFKTPEQSSFSELYS